MQCPTLAELPPPPAGKTGWPWTEETPRLRASPPTGSAWPRVSIVTPSYNQGPFLEETIRSVLLQGYPDLEYVIIDGGSTDQSVQIIRRYEPWLAYWVSERDKGQSDAINRGLARASGEVLGWLNSDDVYARGALQVIGQSLAQAPECALLYGNGWYIDAASQPLERCRWVRSFDPDLLLTFNFILQPAAFWRRSLWEQTGGLDIANHWAMDWEWLIRATALSRPHYLPIDLAYWRIRPEIKTMAGGQARRVEIASISRRYGGVWQPTYIVYRLDELATSMSRRFGRTPLGWFLRYLIIGVRYSLQQTVWRGRHLY